MFKKALPLIGILAIAGVGTWATIKPAQTVSRPSTTVEAANVSATTTTTTDNVTPEPTTVSQPVVEPQSEHVAASALAVTQGSTPAETAPTSPPNPTKIDDTNSRTCVKSDGTFC